MISRIHIELRFEYFLTAGGGWKSDTDWYYFINQSVAKFREVHTLEQYFEKRANIVAPRFASAPWPPVLVDSEAISDQLGASPTAAPMDQREVDPHNVFVVFGRDTRAKDAMWLFLERLGLHPLDWNELVRLTGKGTPHTSHVIEVGFSVAKACVVLMTPDDEARLHADLLEPEDGDHERELTCQPRPNVIFEAGRAFGTHPDHTILVEIGFLRPVSDLAGLNVVRIGATKAPLKALADRLETAGCPVDRKDPDVFDPAAFAQLPSFIRKARAVDDLCSSRSQGRTSAVISTQESDPAVGGQALGPRQGQAPGDHKSRRRRVPRRRVGASWRGSELVHHVGRPSRVPDTVPRPSEACPRSCRNLDGWTGICGPRRPCSDRSRRALRDHRATVDLWIGAASTWRSHSSFPSTVMAIFGVNAQDAKRALKWRPDEEEHPAGEPSEPVAYHCPYCGEVSPADQWWTDEQVDYAQGLASMEAMRLVERELRPTADKINQIFGISQDGASDSVD